ncbi:hypothetical protein [Streptomyces sp. NPDC057854]|uniref:hypothetical protein n=1 Tax=unclassified Streptomyces TaxID=2593676 RepID=UPI0036BC9002
MTYTATYFLNAPALQGYAEIVPVLVVYPGGTPAGGSLSLQMPPTATAAQAVDIADTILDAVARWRDDLADRAGRPRRSAVPLTLYRAAHDSIPLGLYTSREAARAHCEDLMRREGDAGTLVWIPDDDTPEATEDLVVFPVGSSDAPVTGYTVTPLSAAAAYDPEADE